MSFPPSHEHQLSGEQIGGEGELDAGKETQHAIGPERGQTLVREATLTSVRARGVQEWGGGALLLCDMGEVGRVVDHRNGETESESGETQGRVSDTGPHCRGRQRARRGCQWKDDGNKVLYTIVSHVRGGARTSDCRLGVARDRQAGSREDRGGRRMH